ncbi:methyl-accepting chemotaxis protein [Dethiosulfovibrio salsuginis]|uniref:Methyl-accepting chemotaxis protein n=1 Tax=Dethiosulfovibrio salsuginis TaxID=561720 RepID=A0A1X7IQU9_9BACT|nr:methyl-accepting chemotaxis protein [Dethiosulfovibrio salsuginis]SMG17487.1 Methyl-accepting chemotaxis protein [Dethiosulfovibrio salsuginis]
MKISTKLTGGFLLVAVICGIVGLSGYRGLVKVSDVVEELAAVRMEGMNIVSLIHTEQLKIAEDCAQLIQEGLPPDSRLALYGDIFDRFGKAESLIGRFSALPKSNMEQQAWEGFAPAWSGWKDGVDGFLALCGKMDELGIESPTLFKADLAVLLSLHEDWVIDLSEAIVTQTPFMGQLDHTKCDLGKFLASFDINNSRLKDIFKLMNLEHQKIHKGADFINKLIGQKGRVPEEILRDRLEMAYVSRILSPLSVMRRLFKNASEVADQSVTVYGEMAGFYRGEMAFAQEAVAAAMDQVISANQRETVASVNSGREVSSRAIKTSSVAVLVGIVLALGLGFILSRSVTSPIKSVIRFAERGRDGDLTVDRSDFNVGSSGEMNAMAEALSEMMERQRDVVRQILDRSGQFSDGAGTLAALAEEMNASMTEVQNAVDKVAELAEAGAASLQQSSAGIQEIAAGSERAAKSAQDAADAGESSRKSTNDAVAQMAKTIDDVQGLGDQTARTKENISDLATSVESIVKFVSTITTIADQTNLLALNAAIEAARAGEAGRGFAVVAEEVRKLAEESAKAAQEVEKLIDILIDKARKSVTVAEETESMVDGVVARAEQAREKLGSVLEQVDRAAEAIGEIAQVSESQSKSSQEMASAIESVSRTIVDVSDMMDNVRTATDETARASGGVSDEAQMMSGRSDELVDLVKAFKVDREGGLAPVERS